MKIAAVFAHVVPKRAVAITRFSPAITLGKKKKVLHLCRCVRPKLLCNLPFSTAHCCLCWQPLPFSCVCGACVPLEACLWLLYDSRRYFLYPLCVFTNKRKQCSFSVLGCACVTYCVSVHVNGSDGSEPFRLVDPCADFC